MKRPTAAAGEPVLPAGLRRYLYLTAAVSGAAVMIIEILGAKMLAPFVGTSHFVWTAQIAVTLVALAVGYYAGGWLADRAGKLNQLYAAIALAALYLCGVALVIQPVAYWCLEFKLAVGSLLASTILFFFPLALLAMTAPFLVRSLTSSVARVGGSVGRLTAISTLGSFGGTVLIGYVLIPLLPNTRTLLLTAAALFGVVLLYFFWMEPRSRNRSGIVALVVLGALLGGAADVAEQKRTPAEAVELFRGNSNFGLLQVFERKADHVRYYLNDYLVQNTYDPEARVGVSTFTYLLHDLACAYTRQVERVLCIGLGVGLVPSEFARSGAQVDVVEINPAVPAVARTYFNCATDRLHLILADGRQFVNRTTNRYDAIVLDAFLGDSSPSHLLSREAFAAMRRILKPGGALVINCFADFHPRRDFFGASLDKTLKSVFRSVRIHSSGSGNVYFVAADLDALEVLHPPDFSRVHTAVRAQAEAAFNGIRQADPAHGIVLTDDYNPVEYYDAANREEIRRNLARGMQSL